MNSVSPLSALRSRRIRSSDRPWRPHGTNDSSARRVPPSSMGPSKHSTSTHPPSAGSPRRDSAIEKPRSVSVSRQASASSTTSRISSGVSSACRRMRTVWPERSTRPTAWRTTRIERPSNENSRTSTTASSPSSTAFIPAAT